MSCRALLETLLPYQFKPTDLGDNEKFNILLSEHSKILQGQLDVLCFIDNLNIENAQGIWLDLIGKWVGIERPLFSGSSIKAFGFDDATLFGKWDEGYWLDGKSNSVPARDEAYRTYIYLKIAKNNYKPTIPNMYEAFKIAFQTENVVINEVKPKVLDIQIENTKLTSEELLYIRDNKLFPIAQGVGVTIGFEIKRYFTFDSVTNTFDNSIWF